MLKLLLSHISVLLTDGAGVGVGMVLELVLCYVGAGAFPPGLVAGDVDGNVLVSRVFTYNTKCLL